MPARQWRRVEVRISAYGMVKKATATAKVKEDGRRMRLVKRGMKREGGRERGQKLTGREVLEDYIFSSYLQD
jgi:hypothetical protein